MADEQIHPAAAPIRLPEFGNIEFGWGMCRNSMCPNFCVLYGSEDGPGADDLRYELINEAGRLAKLKCRVCGLNIYLHSTTSLREIARHFLSQSLPFADCPNDDCEHHGINAFEFFGRKHGEGKRRRRPYRAARPHELTCNACGRSFPLGTSLWLRPARKYQLHSKKVLRSVSMGRSISDAINSGMKTASYYRQLGRMAPRLRDYLAYRNAHLLRPLPDGRDNETARVYTDVIYAPLRRSEKGRYKGNQFSVIVSSIKLTRTFYVIAAHPYFLPDSKCPDEHDLETDKEKPHFLERRWEALKTFLDDKKSTDEKSTDEKGKKKKKKDPADEGQPGQEILSPYAETAHFLVVERMLSRFGRRFYYMDTSRRLFDSATAAMRDGIRRGRVHVALYQHSTKPKPHPEGFPKSDEKKPRTKERFRRVFAKSEEIFAERTDGLAPDLSGPPEERTLEARRILWRQARNGGYSAPASGTWLPYPPDYSTYLSCRTFWLTRRPSDTVNDGIDLLMNASMHSVDSAHQSMRARIRGMHRRHSVSKGKGLSKRYTRFDVISAELWVYLLFFNYCLFRRDERTVPRAVPMGLADKRDRKVRPHDIAWNFRLGVEHAREISRWLTRA